MAHRTGGLCPSSTVGLEETHQVCEGPLKGAMSAQKVLHGSETENGDCLGETEEKSVSLTRGQ